MRYGRSAPIDVAVIEFPLGAPVLAGPFSTELASLQDAELVRLLDVVVLEMASDGVLAVLEVAELGELGDLAPLVDGFTPVLSTEELTSLARAVAPGRSAAVLVWENTWAEPMVAIATECGGRVVADGRVSPLAGVPVRR